MHNAKLDTYIQKVLKAIHPEMSLSTNVKSQINYFLYLLAVKLVEEAAYLNSGDIYAMENKKTPRGRKTMSARELQSAVKNVLPRELVRHAISEGTKAVTKLFYAYGANKKSRTNRIDRTTKAGLQFSVSRVENIIRDHYKGRIGQGAPIYLAAVLEYICAELLESAGNAARNNKKSTIQSRHLMLAIENDQELLDLVKKIDWNVLGGGELIGVHPILIRKIEEAREKSKTPKDKTKTSRRKTRNSRRRTKNSRRSRK